MPIFIIFLSANYSTTLINKIRLGHFLDELYNHLKEWGLISTGNQLS